MRQTIPFTESDLDSGVFALLKKSPGLWITGVGCGSDDMYPAQMLNVFMEKRRVEGIRWIRACVPVCES
jgi:hypothetical protein